MDPRNIETKLYDQVPAYKAWWWKIYNRQKWNSEAAEEILVTAKEVLNENICLVTQEALDETNG